MGSICLSSASILRCADLTKLENILLVIPTTLEVIFSTSLILVKRGGSGSYLLLTAEGWTFFILAIVELLAEVIPAVRESVETFRTFSVIIGTASLLPLLFYTIFLFIFSRAELIDGLPKRLKLVTKMTLLLFIPSIILFNEITSFAGISIVDSSPGDSDTKITVGFADQEQAGLWTFFTSLTLALLTTYQALIFCLAFFRLVQVLGHQRRIEDKGSDKAHFLNGIGWVSVAAKLGALDTVLGFIGAGFGIFLARRILRMLSRAALCIGVAKGGDVVEDFRAVRSELIEGKNRGRDKFRPSYMRQIISNPRYSSFQRLSPTAKTFHATPRAPASFLTDEKEESGVRHSLLTLKNGLPGMENFADVKDKESRKRVTIHYKNGRPMLHLRFSSLGPTQIQIRHSIERAKPSTLYEDSTKTRSVHSELSRSSFYLDSEKTQQPESALLLPPLPKFPVHRRNRSDVSSFVSALSPGFELVVAPQRVLPQRTAPARVYQASSLNRGLTNATMSSGKPAPSMAFPKPTYLSAGSRGSTHSTRIKSTTSVPDSIQALRDIASQFPGPPSFTHDDGEYSMWEEESPLYRPGSMGPQVIGSPSDPRYMEPERALSRFRTPSGVEIDDDVTWGNDASQPSSPILSRASSARIAGKFAVTAQSTGGYRSSRSLRSIYSQKTIDPFQDDDDQSTIGARSVRLYLQEATPPMPAVTLPESPGPMSPVSAVSGFSQFAVEGLNEAEDPFTDPAVALDSGSSKQFELTVNIPLKQQIGRSSESPQSLSPEEKHNRISEWVDTSASAAVADLRAQAEEPISAKTNSLQNLHDRGKSIDDLVMPWPKNSQMARGEKRKNSRDKMPRLQQQPFGPKLKNVGRAPGSRPTPAPTHARQTRGSLHLRPIVIPPPSGVMTSVLLEQGSPYGRGVLGDSEVLEIEGNTLMRQKRQNLNYF